MKEIVWKGKGKRNVLYNGSFLPDTPRKVDDQLADRLLAEHECFQLVVKKKYKKVK